MEENLVVKGWSEEIATQLLYESGYILRGDWSWDCPLDHQPTRGELMAMAYLTDKHDYGWLNPEVRADLTSEPMSDKRNEITE